jgi:hypothetical protein
MRHNLATKACITRDFRLPFKVMRGNAGLKSHVLSIIVSPISRDNTTV